MFIARQALPTGPVADLAEITDVYFPTAPATAASGSNVLVTGPYTANGTVYCNHVLSTNGVEIGETGTYLVGMQGGFVADFSQQAGFLFFLNTTATAPQKVGTGTSGNPKWPWPWTIAWRFALTAGDDLAIGVLQTSGAVQQPEFGLNGCRLWLVRIL